MTIIGNVESTVDGGLKARKYGWQETKAENLL